MKKLFLAILLACSPCWAQQPQYTGTTTYAVNAKYVQGVGPGYWPTKGSGLTLHLSAGSVVCGTTPTTYAGGNLTMAASSTNYVQIDASSSCAPDSNTSGFIAGDSPIAVVTTSGSAITTITDYRPMGVGGTTTSSGGMVWPTGGAGIPAYSGSSSWGTTYSASNTIPFNFLNLGGTATGLTAQYATALASTPSQCSSGNFSTGVAASGNANCTTVTYADLTGTVTTWNQNTTGNAATATALTSTLGIAGGGTGQTTKATAFNALTPMSTEGDLEYWHSSAAARLAIGTSGQCLTSNGTDPLWGSCAGSGYMVNPMTTAGDTIYGGASGTPERLAIGAANAVLCSTGSAPSWCTTLNASVIPAPTASTLGGVESIATVTHKFLTGLSTGGVFSNGQPASTDLSDYGSVSPSGLLGASGDTTTVNSQACTLGSTCTIPFQVNGTNQTSQAGRNLINSTTNSVGLAVTFSNPGSNQVKAEITGGTYSGTAANGYIGKTTIALSGTINSGSSTTFTVAITGVTTTSICLASFNGAFTGITGFVPSTNGTLSIGAYPTSGNCNFTVLNNTANNITMGSTTLNVVAF